MPYAPGHNGLGILPGGSGSVYGSPENSFAVQERRVQDLAVQVLTKRDGMTTQYDNIPPQLRVAKSIRVPPGLQSIWNVPGVPV